MNEKTAIITCGTWTNVKDGLPKYDEHGDNDYLVVCKVGDKYVRDIGSFGKVIHFMTGETKFEWWVDHDWDEGQGCEVVYWMPYPDLPSELQVFANTGWNPVLQ